MYRGRWEQRSHSFLFPDRQMRMIINLHRKYIFKPRKLAKIICSLIVRIAAINVIASRSSRKDFCYEPQQRSIEFQSGPPRRRDVMNHSWLVSTGESGDDVSHSAVLLLLVSFAPCWNIRYRSRRLCIRYRERFLTTR